MRQQPIIQLPPDYQPAKVIRVLDEAVMQVLGRYNLYLLIPFLLGGIGWHLWVKGISHQPSPDLTLFHHLILGIVALFGTLIIHEAIHGVMMFLLGYRPRFGVFYSGKIPVALYATSDNGYFRRTPFLIMALAPLVLITITCMGLMWVSPVNVHGYIIVALVINGTGAAGDLYMSQVVWGYDEAHTLVLDHAEGITVFTMPDKSAT
jgi:hypothetical protein